MMQSLKEAAKAYGVNPATLKLWLPFEKLIEAWKIDKAKMVKSKPLSASTLARYEEALYYPFKWAGVVCTVSNINAKTLKAGFDALTTHQKQRCLYASRQKAYYAFRSVLMYLQSMGLRSQQEVDAIKPFLPRRVYPEGSHKSIHEQLQFKMLYASIDKSTSGAYQKERVRLAITLIMATCLRAQELLDLTWDDIDLTRNRLYVRCGKGNKRRMVPIFRSTVEALNQWKLNHWHPTKTVLNNWSYNGFRTAFAKLRQHHNLSVNIHGLRASAATHLVEDGASESLVMDILGHKELRTTQRYLKRDEEHVFNAMKAVYDKKNRPSTHENNNLLIQIKALLEKVV
jgi:integrase